MSIYIEVTKGSVKYFPDGSHRDAAHEILDAGESVRLEASVEQPSTMPDLPAWKDSVEATKNAPAVGSASTRDAKTDGEFVISTDHELVMVRQYYDSYWREHLVTPINPLTLTTTETNAVTAALYGAVATP